MVLAMACSSARADDVALVTGEHWTKSSEQLKKAYLIGIANVIQVEIGLSRGKPSVRHAEHRSALCQGV